MLPVIYLLAIRNMTASRKELMDSGFEKLRTLHLLLRSFPPLVYWLGHATYFINVWLLSGILHVNVGVKMMWVGSRNI